jgi:uncharacterized protein YdaU (DUF1376 family)
VSQQIPDNENAEADIAAELAELGRKLRMTVDAAWTSQEREKMQREIEDGLVRLREELNKAAKVARESELGAKVQAEAERVRAELEGKQVSTEIRKGMIVGLRALSSALDKVAGSFTPSEQAEPPKDK